MQPERPSLRERRKAEKLSAIRDAARTLFMTHGFHETPLREVARVADVGFGTVSAYASDKAGLLAMLYVEDLQQLPALFTTVQRNKPVIDQVMDNFTISFRFWSRTPDLSRIILPMLGNTSTNPYIEIILRRRAMIRRSLISWIAECKSLGLVTNKCNEEQVAELLFALYIATINEWLSQANDDVEAGLARLRYLIEIPIAAITQSGA